MSLRWRDRRKQLLSGETPPWARARSRAAASGASCAATGRRPAAPRRRNLAWAPLFAVAVISLLALAALRVSILRTRYALGATLQHETELRARERSARPWRRASSATRTSCASSRRSSASRAPSA